MEKANTECSRERGLSVSLCFRAALLVLLLATAVQADSDSLKITTCKDAWIYSLYATNNYGADDIMEVGDYYSIINRWKVGLLWFDYSAYTYGVSALDSVAVYIYVTNKGTSGAIDETDSIFSLHTILVDHREGEEDGACPQPDSIGATYNERQCHDAAAQCNCDVVNLDWNTAGCWGADTDYDDDDSVTFRYAGNGWYRVRDAVDLVTYQMNNSNYGFRIGDENPGTSGKHLYLLIAGRAYSPSQYAPYIVLYYTEAAAGAGQVIKID